MDIDRASPLLGGLSPRTFMRRHWQRRPLLVRQAWPDVVPPLGRAEMFELAGRDDVESRLAVREGQSWRVRQGPLRRRALPPLKQPGWTLLVQGLDLQVPAAHAMLGRFRFAPDARLDDLMMSWASAGGGVGPHVDSYDVFLIQVHGRRRWRVAPPGDQACIEGLPLKILRRFEPVHDWVLEPGDLLYLPPLWGHDGTAEGGDCMTCSVGFRAPAAAELARELPARVADMAGETGRGGRLYADRQQPATAAPAAVPAALQAFARRAIARAMADPAALDRALGEYLSEPKPRVWFERGRPLRTGATLILDARSRMMYDAQGLYLNGESFKASGRDARLLRRLADERRLDAAAQARLSAQARDVVRHWVADGWLRAEEERPP